MPIASPIGFLDVVNATLRASQVESTSRLTVANTAATKNFSVGDKFHIDKDSVDPVSVTGNVVASGIKISNLTISPTFDLGSVSNVGNTTANTLQFANATTGFTTTANVEIGGNITLTSNAQVKVGSNVLSEYTGPHPRKPKEMPIKKYPEIKFEDGVFDSNKSINTYTQAGYTVTVSSSAFEDAGFAPWKLFNEDDGISTNNGWHSAGNPANVSGSPYNTIDPNYVGEWVKLKLPKAIKLSHISIAPRPDYETVQAPAKYRVYGSNDDSNWVQLIDADNVVYGRSINQEHGGIGKFTTRFSNTTNYYKYMALVMKRATAIQDNFSVVLGEIQYYGSEEPGETVGDLSLDTTLKSTFNSVQSNNHVMYFDGEDPAAAPALGPKNLVNGSSISITPHNATFDATNNCWTLNGSTESNVTTGDLGFKGDVPHTVSMWVNASNLEANSLTQRLFSIGSGYDKALVKVDNSQIAANTWHNVTYAYQGTGGSKVTYIDGRKVEEEKIRDTFGQYPPFAMKDYEQGGFKVTTSSELNQTAEFDDAYKLFNHSNVNTSYWTPVTAGAYSTSDGSYVVPSTGSWSQPNWHFLTNGVAGHWVQIKMPYKIKVDYVRLASSDLSGRQAKDATIFGSNDDGKTWYTVGSWTGNTNNNFNLVSFLMDTSEYYDTYRMVVTRSGNAETITLTELQFFGHKECDVTRFPDPTNVMKYPQFNFTGAFAGVKYETAPTNGYHAAKCRGCIVSASSKYNGTSATDVWRAFDGNIDLTSGSGGQSWDSRINSYASSGTGRASTGTTTFNSRNGEWINIKFPHKVLLSGYQHWTRMDRDHEGPYSGYLYGSNDGFSTFQEIHRFAAITLPTDSGKVKYYHAVSSSYTPSGGSAVTLIPYNEYRLQVTHTQASPYLNIALLEFYGTHDQSTAATPAIVGGPFAGKVANFRVYDEYLGEERIQEIYDAQKDAFGHKKSSMTLYKGRIGVGTTEPDGALTVLDEPHTLEKFPAHDLASNYSYVDGQGIIKVSSSYRGESDRSNGVNDHAIRTDVHGYKAFHGGRTLGWASYAEAGTKMSEEVENGAWLKIQTPQSFSLKKALITSNPSWEQVGSATYGGSMESTTANNNFGRAVAVSHDGTRVIVGGYVDNSFRGKVQVFDWNGSSWQQVGQTLTGDSTSDHFGIGVAISGDGNIIAVGAAFEDISSKTDCGSVRVYFLSGGSWSLLPDSGNSHTGDATSNHQNIFIGQTAYGELGFAGGIKLSYDGRTILMSERLYDSGNITNRGRIRAYTYANGAWSTKGNEFLGVYAQESFGRAVDMSEDGNHIIIGTKHEGGTGQPPRVEVHRWNGSAWVQKGQGLGREVGWGDGFGPSVTISNDGNTIAIGILFADVAEGGTGTNSGSVDVYHWNASTSLWGPTGSASWPAESETSAAAIQARLTTGHKLTKIFDKIDNTRFGDSVSLSGDGKRLIVSESHSDYEVANSGRLYTYEYTGTDWILREIRHPSNGLGDKIGADGRATAYLGMGVHHTGQGLAISRDGSTIVGGEHAYATNGVTASGAVRVFSMPSNIKSIWGSNDDVNWTKITTAPTREEATSNVAGFQFGYNDEINLTNIDNTKYYKYHAIIADAFTQLKEVKLFGIRKKESSTLHDGTLSLTKNLTVPRIGPALDADDTPRRERLVVEYITSTNPMEDLYVKDTSGNRYHAKTRGAIYNPYDRSFQCEANDGNQWIDTLIPNGSRFNTQFSISLWVNMGQFDRTSLYGYICAIGDRNQNADGSSSGNEFGLVYNHAGLTEGAFFLSIEGQTDVFTREWTSHDNHMGQWYHLTATYDGRTVYLYENGENAGFANRTAPILPDRNCVVRLFGDAVNENATHQGVQARISNFKLYDCCLTRDEVRTLYGMGRCDEGHNVVSFEKTRVGIGLGDGAAPKAALDVRGSARIGPSGFGLVEASGDRLLQFHSGQAVSGEPTLEVTHHGGTRASPTPTVLQISNQLGGGSDWSTTEPYALLTFANADGSGSGVGGPAASVGAVCDTTSGGGDSRLAFFTNSGVDHSERMCIGHDGHVGIGQTAPNSDLSIRGNYTNTQAPTTYNEAPPLTVMNASGADGQPICQFRTNQGVTNVRNDGIYHKRGNGDIMQINTSSGHVRFVNGTRGIHMQLGTDGIAKFDCALKANSYNNNSDDRIKHNESYIKNAIQTLFKLKPQIYDKSEFENDVLEHQQYLTATDKDGYEWNDVEDGWIRRQPVSSGVVKKEAGLIAQDVWYDAPELRHIVSIAPDANPDDTKPQDPEPGNIRNDPDYDSAGWGKVGSATVNYINLIPYIIKSIKELYNEVTRHKTRVPPELYSNVQDYHHMIVSKRNDNIHLANTENDKAIHGVISNIKTDTDNYELLIEHTGMGNVWVINTGSTIEVGDYITTSNVTGYGMLQGSGALMNYTLGKSTIDCDFTVQTTPIKQKIRRLQDKTYWVKIDQLIESSFMAYSNLADDVRTTKTETYYNVYENKHNTNTAEHITLQYVLDNEEPNELVESEMNFEKYSNTYAFNTPFHTGPQTRTKYYRKQISKIENEMEGYEPIVEQEMMDVLDDNGQVQWEDTGDTKPLYELRYLTIDGSITEQSNAVYTASLIPVSLHL